MYSLSVIRVYRQYSAGAFRFSLAYTAALKTIRNCTKAVPSCVQGVAPRFTHPHDPRHPEEADQADEGDDGHRLVAGHRVAQAQKHQLQGVPGEAGGTRGSGLLSG